jgi:hypothetical protein
MTLTDAEYDAHKEGKLNWVGFRPEYRGDDIKLHEAGKKVQREFDRAYRKVTGNMAADGRDLTPHNGYVEKKARIASLLKDRIKELEAEGEDPAVTKWLTKTVEHFEDTHEKSKDEYYVEEISLRSKAEIRETTTEIYKEEIRAREAAERRGEIEKVETTEKATEYEREY